MALPSPPAGYDISKSAQASRSDCLLTVGFDRHRSQITRFIVQLHYQTDTNPVEWGAIARMDHNETAPLGHDVYREGLHVDVARRSRPPVKLKPSHAALPASRGKVLRACKNYLDTSADYFIDVYEQQISPGSPPRWPDGGDQSSEAPTFMTTQTKRNNSVRMSQESPAEEPISDEELTELIAEAEGTTPEKIEQGAADIEIEHPSEADVIEQ